MGDGAPGERDKDLSDAEMRVLVLVAGGLTDAQVAARLGLSVHTVRHRVGGLMDRWGYRSRTELVVRCLVDQVLELDWPVRAGQRTKVAVESRVGVSQEPRGHLPAEPITKLPVNLGVHI